MISVLVGCHRPSPETRRVLDRLASTNVAIELKATTEAVGHPNPPVCAALLDLFENRQKPAIVRGAAAVALGRIRDPRIVSLILNRLPAAILKASKTVPPNNLEPYLLGKALAAYGPQSLTPLSTLLNNPHKEVVAWAIVQHSLYPYNDSAFAVLAHYLDSPDLAFRRAAAIGLARSYHKHAEALALRHLNDPDPQIRFQLAWGLVNWGSAEAINPLKARLAQEKEPRVRQELALALEAARSRPAAPSNNEAAQNRNSASVPAQRGRISTGAP